MFVVLNVMEYTYNLVFETMFLALVARANTRQREALTQRINTGQITPYECLVDHDGERSAKRVVVAEKAPTCQAYSESAEEAWRHRLKIGHGRMILIERLTGDREREAVVTGKGNTCSESGVSDTRYGAKMVDELVLLNNRLFGWEKCLFTTPAGFGLATVNLP